MSKIEIKLHKIVPEMIDLFVTPLTTVIVTALATFMVIGPIFATLENLGYYLPQQYSLPILSVL